MSDLTALLDRVRAATGPDRELDADLWWALARDSAERTYWRATLGKPQKAPDRLPDGLGRIAVRGRSPMASGSIDAALALAERMLPGTARPGFVQQPDRSWHGTILWVEPEDAECPEEVAPTAPLAILAALLSALIERKE